MPGGKKDDIKCTCTIETVWMKPINSCTIETINLFVFVCWNTHNQEEETEKSTV